jgi:hypothetical protein
MKNLFVKISLTVLLVVIFVVFTLSIRNDQTKFDPEKEWAHLLVKKSDDKSDNNSTSSVDNSTKTSNVVNSDKPKIKKEYSDDVKEYFNLIALKSEFKGNRKKALKWTSDMKIFVDGEKKDYLISELKRIVKELNDIIDPIEIKIVNSKSESNYVVYFGNYQDLKNDYKIYYPDLLENNYGYFEITPNNSGLMYVDITRTLNVDAQKHLIREELTQSLGLLNDSYKYPESIFYQGWTTTTEFAPIDKELIDMLYNN